MQRGDHTCAECLEVVAAFEYQRDPPGADLIGECDQPLRQRGVSGDRERQRPKWVGPMGVVTGRYEDELRIERSDRRDEQFVVAAAEPVVASSMRQWEV